MAYELYLNGKLNTLLLKENKWLTYLFVTDNISVNIERINKLSEITGKETIEYVLRTLEVFEQNKTDNEKINYLVEETLKWCEVAKGGKNFVRKLWVEKGYNLDVHNIGSSEIYNDESNEKDIVVKTIIKTLIKTHGLIGQYIRGEVCISENKSLKKLVDLGYISESDMKTCLKLLNKCIIEGVSPALYSKLEKEVNKSIEDIISGNFIEKNTRERILGLKPNCSLTDAEINLVKSIFSDYIFWYIEPSVKDLESQDFLKILLAIKSHKNIFDIKHINFKNMLNDLYYEYEGVKKINTYKKRIIENLLNQFTYDDILSGKKIESQHTWLQLSIHGDTLNVTFEFTKASLKLIEFCVEAERTGIVEFQKSIVLLYDMFGLRKDSFDRLSNEDKYLDNMNASEQKSTKKNILDYITGDNVLDVGTGGGVMLDRIVKARPEISNVSGCDISNQVITNLEKKKSLENKKWNVFELDLVKKPADSNFDTIIFSSIIHEIYSYSTVANGNRYDIENVYKALENAVKSLNKGGRIIIRDGIKVLPENNHMVGIKLKDELAIKWLEQFIKDFKAFDNDVHPPKIRRICYDTFEMPLDYAREAIFHMSWTLTKVDGSNKIFSDNYTFEKEEAFGYLTLNDYEKLLKSYNCKIVECKEFLEDGYLENTRDRMDLTDINGLPIDYPNSTCFIVIEKE